MKLRELHVAETGHELEQNLHVYGASYSIGSLRDPFLQTYYADLLGAMEPRFGNYSWEDTEKFVELMGDDVDPLLHGPYQARTVGMPMIDAQRNNPNDDVQQLGNEFTHLFVAHHVQHDDHEGEFARMKQKNRDEAYETRTIETEVAEYELWSSIQSEIFGDLITAEHLARVQKFAHPEAENSFCKDFWDISEAIGYLFTALRARDIALHAEGLSTSERDASLRLAVDVSGRHVHRIEEKRGKIVYADDVIQGFMREIIELRKIREAN